MADAPLRVLLDASAIKAGQGGIRTYGLNLAHALAAGPELDVVVAAPSGLRDDLPEGATLAAIAGDVAGPGRRALWRERELPRLAAGCGADVVVSPTHELPLTRMRVPTVMVVHDVGPLLAPALYGGKRWLRYAAVLRRTAAVASRVVCVSRTTRLQLCGALPVDAGKCRVITQGGGRTRQASADPGRAGVPDGDFVLYVGSMYRHKNVATLVAAFADPVLLPGTRLVLAGMLTDAEAAEVERLRAALPDPSRVVHLGYVDDERLGRIYAAATVVALPSLFEGFGLPVLEAMQRGKPIVASQIPAFREIAGDAIRYVDDPLSPAAWRRALTKAVAEPGTSRKASFVPVLAEHNWATAGQRFRTLLGELAP